MDKAYGQTQPYIPATDSGFRDWLLNFSTLISADPAKYGVDASDATIIANLNTSYAAAYQTVQAPSTRTPNAVGQKDALKASARASCRVYAMQIKANAGVDNQDKIQLGIHVNDPTPTPIPAPTSARRYAHRANGAPTRRGQASRPARSARLMMNHRLRP